MDIYKLYRAFWDFAFENPEKIKPNEVAVYCFAIEHCNRLGWKKKFGFPTTMVMEAVGIKSYSVYRTSLIKLVDYGFIEMVESSRNQYSANIIALKENYKANSEANYEALDKALVKHVSKQHQSTLQSIDSIDKQVYNNTNLQVNNNTTLKRFTPPSISDVQSYCIERGNNIEPQKFINYYESIGWKVGKNQMKDWKAAIRNWESRDKAEAKPAQEERKKYRVITDCNLVFHYWTDQEHADWIAKHNKTNYHNVRLADQ
jgi:virulence-associated protein VapD